MLGSFATIIIEWIGEDEIHKFLLGINRWWNHNMVKMLGNGDWKVYAGQEPVTECGSSLLFDDGCTETGFDIITASASCVAACVRYEEGAAIKRDGWAYLARMEVRTVDVIGGPLEAAITAVWDIANRLVNMVLAWALGELKEAGTAAMEGQAASTAINTAGDTVAPGMAGLIGIPGLSFDAFNLPI